MDLSLKDIHKYIADHTEMWDAMNNDSLFSYAIKEIDENASSDSVLGALVQMTFTSCALYETLTKIIKDSGDPKIIVNAKDAVDAISKQYADYITTIKKTTSSTSQ